jgi:hypothetical protein
MAVITQTLPKAAANINRLKFSFIFIGGAVVASNLIFWKQVGEFSSSAVEFPEHSVLWCVRKSSRCSRKSRARSLLAQ